MPRSPAASLFVDDEPILRFEESSPSPTPSPRRTHASLPPGESAANEGNPYGSLKRKQEELLKLRQELERTERETSHLEAQRRKEERFVSGRREISEKLSRSLVRLERELYNAQKAIEEITAARDLFQRHLDLLRGLKPEAWQRNNLDGELDRAIAAIDDAEVEFCKTSRRLAATLPGEAGAEAAAAATALPGDFRGWVRAGFAFTLPATVVLLIVICALFVLARSIP